MAQKATGSDPQILGMEHMPPAVVDAVDSPGGGGSAPEWTEPVSYSEFADFNEVREAGVYATAAGFLSGTNNVENGPPLAGVFGTLIVSAAEDVVWEGGVRRVFSAPDGDLTNPDIGPCEVIVDAGVSGIARINVLIMLEPGDLEQLAETGHLWLSMLGGLRPFSLETAPPHDQTGG